MEAALVSVGTAAMKPVLSKLYKMLQEDYARTKGVGRLVGSSMEEMRSMKAALETLQDAEELDPEMVIWRDEVRELTYDMEDCLDDFEARADHHRHAGFINGFVDKLKKLKPRHEIAGKIKKLNKRAMEASEKHKRYRADHPASNPATTSEVDPRLHALYVEVGKLVGIHGPKEHIIKWINDKDREGSSQTQVVSIVGPGGLGKTTLANAVYQYIRGEFSCAAFVSVSRKPNIKDVLREIAEKVGITADNTCNDNERRLIDRLRDHLQDKRYLIVVDDIWSAEAWITIRDALINNDRGSRIITSTRSNTVASCCCSQGGYVYKMEPLSFVDSRRLFYERAFRSEHLFPPNLKEISERILEKCAGLPLAIITLSSLLADQSAKAEWERVLAALGSSLTNESQASDMKKIISLSYFDLPYPVRTCFLYLSAFPEDHIIEKQSLIHKWIAEGFIPEGQARSTYEVGEAYFYDLINRSLIQPATSSYRGSVEFDQVEECRVHDIILDFITCKASEENFMTSFDETEHGKKQKVRRLSVVNRNNSQMAIMPGDLDHVRSLVIFGYLGQSSLLGFPALRVLDLGECLELENSHLLNIEKLFLLKFLRLGSTRSRQEKSITELPENIGGLQYLETLDIRGTHIEKLPSSITLLKRLRYLYHSNCCSSYRYSPEEHTHAHGMIEQLACLSHGKIGQLQSLEELVNIHVHPSQASKFLEELVKLTKLRTLDVTVMYPLHFKGDDGAEDVKEFIGNLLSSYNLHHLCIQYMAELSVSDLLSLESFCPANPDKLQLQSICIWRYYIDKIPTWMRLLVNLRKLDLQMYRTGQEDIDILGAIPALAFLKLKTYYGRNGWIFIRGFRSLKYFNLEITYCGTAVVFEKGSMPKLETLKLQFNAHTKECANDASDLGIQHLSALTKVEVFVRGYAVDSLIIEAVATLPNRPTLSLKHPPLKNKSKYCRHFDYFIHSISISSQNGMKIKPE